MTDLAELRRLLAEASPGTWLVKLTGFGMGRLFPSFCLGDTDPVEWREADYHLIVALRNAAPALLAMAERAEELALRVAELEQRIGDPLARCSRCGCPASRHAVDDEELRECRDCECDQYEARIARPFTTTEGTR